MEKEKKICYGLVFVFFLITYGYFFQGGGWNQNSRLCLTRAIVQHRTFQIDRFKEDSKEPFFEFVNTGDWCYSNGHYYTSKSPGVSMMAVAPFGLSSFFMQRIVPKNPERQIHVGAYIATLFTTVLCSALLCLLVFAVCHSFFKLGRTNALLLTFYFGLGTLGFSYATTFYCHMITAFFSFLTFFLAMLIRHGSTFRKKNLAFYSGLAAGLGVLVEPTAVFPLACVFVYLCGVRPGYAVVLFFLIGCFLPGLVQCAYNLTCFGNPFDLGLSLENPTVVPTVDGNQVGFPRLSILGELLFLPYRGLFVTSPVLLMLLPGTLQFLKQKKWRLEAVLCIVVAVIFMTFESSFYSWWAGSTAGPRHLLPAFPFLFLLCVFALRKYPLLFNFVGVVSVFINLCITLVGNEVPASVKNPLVDVIFKNIFQGKVSINPVPFSNFENYPDLSVLAYIDKWEQNFNSFNLGELIFPHHIASILPLFGIWLLWAWAWKRLVVKKDEDA